MQPIKYIIIVKNIKNLKGEILKVINDEVELNIEVKYEFGGQ